MFCRLTWSESHMNPFSEDACCLFRIGAKKQEGGFSSGGTPLGRLQVRSCRARTLLSIALALWILLGMLALLPLIPYVAYHKLVKSRKYAAAKGSYLIAKAQQR